MPERYDQQTAFTPSNSGRESTLAALFLKKMTTITSVSILKRGHSRGIEAGSVSRTTIAAMLFVISFLLPRQGGHGITLETEYCYGVIRTRIDLFLTNDDDDDGMVRVVSSKFKLGGQMSKCNVRYHIPAFKGTFI